MPDFLRRAKASPRASRSEAIRKLTESFATFASVASSPRCTSFMGASSRSRSKAMPWHVVCGDVEARGRAMARELLEKVTERLAETSRGEMLYRELGRTGERISVVGLGGHHIGRPKDEA